jgi:hypothetical protein
MAEDRDDDEEDDDRVRDFGLIFLIDFCVFRVSFMH